MIDPSPDLLLMEVPCDRHAPALVRQALAEVQEVDSSLSDGVLVASELVTDAVLHSGCGAEHMLEVRASLCRDRLRISVRDAGPVTAGPRHVSDSEFRPWGVRIIARLSQRWGCERPDGYRIWAEVALGA
jgi:hypothetical protein